MIRSHMAIKLLNLIMMNSVIGDQLACFTDIHLDDVN